MKKLIVAQVERVINKTPLRPFRSRPLPPQYSRHKAHAAPVMVATAVQHAFVDAVVKATRSN